MLGVVDIAEHNASVLFEHPGSNRSVSPGEILGCFLRDCAGTIDEDAVQLVLWIPPEGRHPVILVLVVRQKRLEL